MDKSLYDSTERRESPVVSAGILRGHPEAGQLHNSYMALCLDCHLSTFFYANNEG